MTRLWERPGGEWTRFHAAVVRAVCELMKEPEAADVSRLLTCNPLEQEDSEIADVLAVMLAGRCRDMQPD